MSIDFYYKHTSGKKITKEELTEKLSSDFDILKVTTNKNGTVSYFAINSKDKEKNIYEKGYEFHLQEDGRYWHPTITRDDNEMETENEVVNDIVFNLDLELEF